MMKGEPGGYYTPSVDAEGNLTWTPSEEELAAVESSNIRGPQGLKGETGVYVGEAEPTDEDALVWINPAGAASESLATKAYVDEQIAGLEVNADLSNYYNKEEVDAKIPDTSGFALKSEIPSLDGYAKTTDIPDTSKFITEVPAEYVTETELEEAIAAIDIPETDLSGYYTKDEIDDMLANLPAGDIPSGEGVEF